MLSTEEQKAKLEDLLERVQRNRRQMADSSGTPAEAIPLEPTRFSTPEVEEIEAASTDKELIPIDDHEEELPTVVALPDNDDAPVETLELEPVMDEDEEEPELSEAPPEEDYGDLELDSEPEIETSDLVEDDEEMETYVIDEVEEEESEAGCDLPMRDDSSGLKSALHDEISNLMDQSEPASRKSTAAAAAPEIPPEPAVFESSIDADGPVAEISGSAGSSSNTLAYLLAQTAAIGRKPR